MWIIEGLEKLAAIMEQDKIYLLHKLKFWQNQRIEDELRWRHDMSSTLVEGYDMMI